MIKVSILYPNKPGGRFDFDYYVSTHMPMSLRLLGAAIRGVSIERGLTAPEPWAAPAFTVLCHFVCESREAFEAAFFPHAAVLQADMARCTDIVPVIQISEIALARSA
jgi:uncharacterized protein (TIGR02118 family)